MATNQSPNITVMIKAARKASSKLRRDFGEVEQLQISNKGPGDFVTNADIRTEEILRDTLDHARPGYGFLMEESGEIIGSEVNKRWIIDPIDGTTNFIHGIPHFAISIALEDNGEIVAGVVYEPINDQMFWAEKGNGAWLNDRRIRVSGRKHIRDSIFATGIPLEKKNQKNIFKQIENVITASAGIRRFGSAALDLAYVAAGRFDGFWETNLNAWDIAAGIVLIKESGGMISEINGGENLLETGSVVATNPNLYTEFRRIIQKKND
ncbi:MAG: inositol monophosphatase [Rhodospirillales bacterium]|nr:inositol monophosphatase [Rhodospirillales bacterium]MDC0988918.1 inositol monophosphatase family protein [Rhodospirillales bacterium]